MAKTTTPEANNTVEAAPTADLFELDSTELDLIKPNSGRKAQPSKYLAEVKAAKESGKPYGIPVPEGTKATSILAEIRKAAQQLDVKVQTWDRSQPKEGQKRPFVAFKVKPATPATEHHDGEHGEHAAAE